MRECSASFTRAASSSKDRSFTIAFSASARYMAPLSRFTYPSLRASRDAIVLLPAPAGPSIAIISLRAGGWAAVSLIGEDSFQRRIEKDQDEATDCTRSGRAG